MTFVQSDNLDFSNEIQFVIHDRNNRLKYYEEDVMNAS